ncbi:hypothetical protein V6N12_068024 [Hibiscus sabdariffa]|uniref:Uncharacterized protein n=1 Tax=Hibiscus sabdariffa TaxID=183260 RepID=A0ABR2FNS6_9ROSI
MAGLSVDRRGLHMGVVRRGTRAMTLRSRKWHAWHDSKQSGGCGDARWNHELRATDEREDRGENRARKEYGGGVS